MQKFIAVVISIFAVSICASTALADGPVSGESKPRFMLNENFVGYTSPNKVKNDHALAASEFSWAKLAKSAAARGADPVIGDVSKASFYDFSDENSRPIYFQKESN